MDYIYCIYYACSLICLNYFRMYRHNLILFCDMMSFVDKLEGVAGSKLFQIQNSLSKVVLHWEEYGLRIKVPEGAVPPSETIEVTITALVGGDFILPEDSELVSAVYAITVSEPSSSLLKPVTLEIQHCVSIETLSHASDLSFVISSSDNGPFQFQDKGSFLVGERYGSIDVTTFSSWAIIQTIKGWFKKFRHSNRSITPQADRSLMQGMICNHLILHSF